MGGIHSQKFEHKLPFNGQPVRQVARFCEEHIGYQTYRLAHQIGGKKWKLISTTSTSGTLYLDDPEVALLFVLSSPYG